MEKTRFFKELAEAYKVVGGENGGLRDYRQCNDVRHLGKTALCFVEVADNGVINILKDPKEFPDFCTAEYIVQAVKNGARDLGRKRFCFCKSGTSWRLYNGVVRYN